MMQRRNVFVRTAIALASLFGLAGASHAKLVEDQIDVTVKVIDMYGKTIEQAIKVTVFSDTTNNRPAPVMILNHGRAADADERVALGRARYSEASKWFVDRGFVVAVPTRVGYGVSGGADVEDSGKCASRNYPPGYLAAANETLAVLEAVRKRSDASKDRAVVLGQSYGGAVSATIASLKPAGVQLAINFAGGGGGNPKTQPQNPCSPGAMGELYRSYGKTAVMPMLWIYTENDMYFGPKIPKDWYAAYTSNGAKAEFVQFPAQGEDGHALFTRYPETWQPKVAEFLDNNGYKVPSKSAVTNLLNSTGVAR